MAPPRCIRDRGPPGIAASSATWFVSLDFRAAVLVLLGSIDFEPDNQHAKQQHHCAARRVLVAGFLDFTFHGLKPRCEFRYTILRNVHAISVFEVSNSGDALSFERCNPISHSLHSR